MAIQCPQCRRQYDVTLFEFQRAIECDCGATVDLREGHVHRVGPPPCPPGWRGTSRAAGQGHQVEAIAPATRAYLAAPHIAEDYDRYFAHSELFRFDGEVLDRWLSVPGRLLDLGCGSGRHVVHFAARGFDVTGVDLSHHMLAVTRRKLAACGCRATLVHGDITRLDELGLGRFDYILCMFSTLGMVHGSSNRQRLLASVRQHLETNGLFAFHVHNRWHNLWDPNGRRYLWGALRGRLRGRPEAFQKDMDGYRGIADLSLYLYSDREVRRTVARAGLRVEEFVYLNRVRNGALRGVARGLRSNGFIVLCRPAGEPG
ncbi:MAG TPA: methyltransferase domain-containing protein [Planctomycetota bacterium]|nr:methyltransferase domain-containing protein [Planctomycetota bacterium]